MFHMRPGTKLPSGERGYKNKPSIEPPGLLKLVSALSMLSIVGVLIFAVAIGLSVLAPAQNDAEKAIYIAFLHFILPFGVTYTVTTNNRLSRYIIAIYSLILGSATIAGKGFLGGIPASQEVRSILSVAALILVLVWLFRSPRMRYYYALISDQPVPADLAARAAELSGSGWLGTKSRAAIEWTLGHMETVVLIGFTIIAVYSCASI